MRGNSHIAAFPLEDSPSETESLKRELELDLQKCSTGKWFEGISLRSRGGLRSVLVVLPIDLVKHLLSHASSQSIIVILLGDELHSPRVQRILCGARSVNPIFRHYPTARDSILLVVRVFVRTFIRSIRRNSQVLQWLNSMVLSLRSRYHMS
jgi:hypothetical protein